MGDKIKLIWDFRGPDAAKTAEHHERHLKEYIASEGTALDITGHIDLGELHSYAFMVVEKSEMIPIRDALKPHRGEIFTG